MKSFFKAALAFLSLSGSALAISQAQAGEMWAPTVKPGHAQPYFADACLAAEYSYQDNYGVTPPTPPVPFLYCIFTGPTAAWAKHDTIYAGSGNAGPVSCSRTNTEGGCLDNKIGSTVAFAKSNSNTPRQCSANAGNPINTLSGNKEEFVVDYSSAGPDPLTFERYYTSEQNYPSWARNSSVGQGWRSNFDGKVLTSSNNGVTVLLPNGRLLKFARVGSTDQFVPAYVDTVANAYALVPGLTGQPETMTQSSAQPGHVEVTGADGTLYVFDYYHPSYNFWTMTSVSKPGGYKQTLNYDTNGRLASVSDNRGRSLTFNYSNGLISDVIAGGVTVAHFTYKSIVDQAAITQYFPQGIPQPLLMTNAVLQTASYPNNGSESVTYLYENTTFPMALTGLTDGRGVRYATWAYDAQGRAISSQHAGGVDLNTVNYDTANNRIIITNPASKQRYINYTTAAWSRILPTSVAGQPSANCPASNEIYAYDANNYVSQVTDAEGRVTTYVNDATTGLPTTIVRGAGTAGAVTTTVTWNAKWRVPAQLVEPGLTTTYNWDADGKLLSTTQTDTTTQTVPYSTSGQTRTWTYTYDASGRLLTSTGPVSGSTVTYTYDTSGNLSTVTNEVGKVTTINSVNLRGQPTQITDANGVITALAYDGRGRLTSFSVDTASSPSTTTIAYDLAGDVVSITDPIGASQTFTWDGARRLTAVTNNLGEKIAYGRDAMGNATSVTVTTAAAATTFSKTQTFDELGRLIKSVGAVAANSQYKFAYDKTDNLVSVTNPASNVTSNGFDALNRLITQTDEQNAVVTLTRNGVDAITNYKDARNLSTGYVRNGFGEIIQEVSPDKGTTTFVRDARGLVTQRTDARGIVTNFTYDNAGRLTGKTYAGKPQYYVSYTWDTLGGGNYGVGRQVGVSDESGIDWRVFDTKGRVKTYYRTSYPAPAVTSYYNYDAAGNVTGMSYPSGRFVGFSRDATGRITGIVTYPTPTSTTGTTIASSVTWNPFGGIKSVVLGNGLTQAFAYDTDYRVTRVQVGNAAQGVGAWLDRSLTWTGDMAMAIADNQFPGNTTAFTYAQQSQTFTYTATRRLASAKGYYGTLSWTYDVNGNRATETTNGVASTYAYPAGSNRLTSVTPSGGSARSFTYDASGNIATDSRTGALGMTYQYDPEGRLSKVFQTNATANGATYLYDANSRLSQRIVTQTVAPTSTTTVYVHDLNDRIIAELNASGQTQREYIWLDDMPIAVVDNVASGSPVIYFVHVDHLIRPARMTAQNASWVWDVIYSPFGAVSYIWTNPATQNLRFPGQWFQLESGLAYNWHRHYDATLGRYVQPDPLGLEALLTDGPSAYGYVRQNPTAYVDDRGQFAWIPFIVAAGTAMLTAESANAPGPDDQIIQSDPLSPYVNGVIAGMSVAGAEFCAVGKEIKGANWRVAPGGNRTGHPFGRWPHYHRRGEGSGQGISRHRPWETNRNHDKSFWDRF